MTLKQFIERWPLLQQIRHGLDGTGLEARSERTRSLRPKHHDAQVAHSVCPYCGVGCAQLVYHRDGKLISIIRPARRAMAVRSRQPVGWCSLRISEARSTLWTRTEGPSFGNRARGNPQVVALSRIAPEDDSSSAWLPE